MTWISKIRNYNELPKNKFWVSIQFGKADYYDNHSPFSNRDVVIVFETKETADYFIKNWENNMSDYREACLKEDYKFWVIFKTNLGYYADDINMEKDYVVKK